MTTQTGTGWRTALAVLAVSMWLGPLTVTAATDVPQGTSPLQRLPKAQREQYEAYREYNSYLENGKPYDRKALCRKLYGPVAKWFTEAQPRFKTESIRCGERAGAAKSPQHAKQFKQMEQFYLQGEQACMAVLKAYQTGEIGAVGGALQAYGKLEQEARTKKYRILKRDWLTPSDCSRLFFANRRYEQSRGKAPKDAPKPPETAPVPPRPQPRPARTVR